MIDASTQTDPDAVAVCVSSDHPLLGSKTTNKAGIDASTQTEDDQVSGRKANDSPSSRTTSVNTSIDVSPQVDAEDGEQRGKAECETVVLEKQDEQEQTRKSDNDIWTAIQELHVHDAQLRDSIDKLAGALSQEREKRAAAEERVAALEERVSDVVEREIPLNPHVGVLDQNVGTEVSHAASTEAVTSDAPLQTLGVQSDPFPSDDEATLEQDQRSNDLNQTQGGDEARAPLEARVNREETQRLRIRIAPLERENNNLTIQLAEANSRILELEKLNSTDAEYVRQLESKNEGLTSNAERISDLIQRGGRELKLFVELSAKLYTRLNRAERSLNGTFGRDDRLMCLAAERISNYIPVERYSPEIISGATEPEIRLAIEGPPADASATGRGQTVTGLGSSDVVDLERLMSKMTITEAERPAFQSSDSQNNEDVVSSRVLNPTLGFSGVPVVDDSSEGEEGQEGGESSVEGEDNGDGENGQENAARLIPSNHEVPCDDTAANKSDAPKATQDLQSRPTTPPLGAQTIPNPRIRFDGEPGSISFPSASHLDFGAKSRFKAGVNPSTAGSKHLRDANEDEQMERPKKKAKTASIYISPSKSANAPLFTAEALAKFDAPTPREKAKFDQFNFGTPVACEFPATSSSSIPDFASSAAASDQMSRTNHSGIARGSTNYCPDIEGDHDSLYDIEDDYIPPSKRSAMVNQVKVEPKSAIGTADIDEGRIVASEPIQSTLGHLPVELPRLSASSGSSLLVQRAATVMNGARAIYTPSVTVTDCEQGSSNADNENLVPRGANTGTQFGANEAGRHTWQGVGRTAEEITAS